MVVASEAMDGESGWRMLSPGELVHVRADLSVESRIAVPEAPAHLVPLPAGESEHRHLTGAGRARTWTWTAKTPDLQVRGCW